MGIEDVDLAIERVNHRVLQGGHGIPEETIRKRFKQSLINLELIAPICDHVMIYDNTDNFEFVYQCDYGKVVLKAPNNIEWIPDCFK